MKILISTLLAILFCLHVSAQDQFPKFRITINERDLGGSAITIITHDSIVSTHFVMTTYWMNLKQGMNGYPNKVIEAIRKIENEKLADSYNPPKRSLGPDDYYEFDFTFEINGNTKKTYIHGGRQKQILEFVKQINEMIPTSFQIPYDEKYLGMHERKR